MIGLVFGRADGGSGHAYGSQVRFEVLGPLRAGTVAGPVAVPAGLSASALCWLIAHANRSVSFESLAGVLWDDPPPTAVAKVRMIVRSLAVLFPAGTFEIGPRARLIASAEAIDATQFERLAHEARTQLAAGDIARAQTNLQAGLELWRGEPYHELRHGPSTAAVTGQLVELRLQAVEDLNAIVLRASVDYTVVADLRAQVILHPDRVRLHRQLALALYRTDRQVEALEVLQELRQSVGDDGQTALLQDAILHHEPQLTDGELPPG